MGTWSFGIKGGPKILGGRAYEPQWFHDMLIKQKSHTEKLCIYTFCIEKLYKIYTTGVCKMDRNCLQNIFHIWANFYIHFVHKIKRAMAAKFYKQNVYKHLLRCGIHFVYILHTFCIHQFGSTESAK